ncbi:hypothetical protein FACS1894206_04170 [Deltaproteobacteria bacterium]|nr:hypothetical protein FACS1894206_04170 [Deltaproteobacteria bacterium]
MRIMVLADDCGVSDANTSAIIECLDAGRISGTSLLAGGKAAAHAADLLGGRWGKNKAVKLGVHLNLFDGCCVADPREIPQLADEQGGFRFRLGNFLRKMLCASGKDLEKLNAQAAIEWQAQIDAVKSLLRAGAGEDIPLYLDGHQHIHAIPALRPALTQILQNNVFTHVRVTEELRCPFPVPAPLYKRVICVLRRELLTLWGKNVRRIAEEAGLATPDYFIGGLESGNLSLAGIEYGLRAVAAAGNEDALVEIMIHPGGDSGLSEDAATGTFRNFYTSPEREREKNLILSEDFLRLAARYDAGWNASSPQR